MKMQEIKLVKGSVEVTQTINVLNAMTPIATIKTPAVYEYEYFNGALLQLWLKDVAVAFLPDNTTVEIVALNRDKSESKILSEFSLLGFNNADQWNRQEQLRLKLKEDKTLKELEYLQIRIKSSVAIVWANSDFGLEAKKYSHE